MRKKTNINNKIEKPHMYFVANKTDFSIDFGQNVQENCFKRKKRKWNFIMRTSRYLVWYARFFRKLCIEP